MNYNSKIKQRDKSMFGGDTNESKKRELPWAAVRDIMKSVGAEIVEKDAVTVMLKMAVDMIKTRTSKALKITRHGNNPRKKLTVGDIEVVGKVE